MTPFSTLDRFFRARAANSVQRADPLWPGFDYLGVPAGGRPLDMNPGADIMSDMRTFTVRDLDRSPGEVLEASRIDGKVRIRARGGQTYIIIPEETPKRRISDLPDFAARRAALLARPLSSEFARRFDRALAGE